MTQMSITNDVARFDRIDSLREFERLFESLGFLHRCHGDFVNYDNGQVIHVNTKGASVEITGSRPRLVLTSLDDRYQFQRLLVWLGFAHISDADWWHAMSRQQIRVTHEDGRITIGGQLPRLIAALRRDDKHYGRNPRA